MAPPLTDAEHSTILCLLRVPGLWAFSLLAGRFGLDEAVAMCDGDLSDEALGVLGEGSYTPDHLPDGETIKLALLGARVLARSKTRDVAEIYRELGTDPVEALRAHAALTRYVRPRDLRDSWR